MKKALTAAQMRALDQAAGDAHGMPASVLMENAGAALAAAALELADDGGRFFVLCGAGNNGGDGLVAARKLATAGRTVYVETVVPAESLKGEPERVYKALTASGVTASPIPSDVGVGAGDVVIDALFGTGLSRSPEGAYADAIRRIDRWRDAGAKVVAADLPSGLRSDNGEPFEPCVRADLTLSFGELKIGHVLEPGVALCGELKVADIGIPPRAAAAIRPPFVQLIEESDARERVPPRSSGSHKGTFGHVLVVAGSWGKTGAAALAGKSALRGGAGLVTIATRPESLVPVMAHAPELMGVELVADGGLRLADLNPLLEAAEKKQAVVIGPGIPVGEETAKLLAAFLEETSVPCLLDADALNALAGDLSVLDKAKGPLLLTPHPGEMGRLLGKSTAEVQADRLGAARALATAHHVVVALKGARTLIALEDGTVWVNPTGNAGMATGGTGDVLSGLCGALLAQGLSTEDAAILGVYAHGLAGDLGSHKWGKPGLIASDVIDALGEVWSRWLV